jgi:hypothetical protein
VAVVANPDVSAVHLSWRDLLTHDFWGNEMFSQREQVRPTA